jgi:hypothetical protein
MRVAEDVEGMSQFVNGAAEILWEKGVREMAFQAYGGPGSGSSAEAFRYEFRSWNLARDFWKESCPGPSGELAGGGSNSGSCERSESSLSQAFFWADRMVLEVRSYGAPEVREALFRGLDSVLSDPSGLAGSEGSFPP